MPTHISLPTERVEQLRMIARATNTAIAEVIARFVRAEIAAGTIPADIPGIDVVPDGRFITISAKGFEAVVPMDEGPTLADLLKESGGATSDPQRKKRWLEGSAAMSGMKLKRAGNGVKLVSPATGRELPLNLDVAVDLAEQIERVSELRRLPKRPRPTKSVKIVRQ
jgi:hypothetical protein